MEKYFRVMIPVFIGVFAYTALTVFLGPKGIYAKRFIEIQRDALVNHVRSLRQTGEDLDSLIRNLTYDPETIAVYAHELGYIYNNEGIIKLVNFNSGFGKALNPGTILKIETPYFLSDYMCKTIAISLGIIVIIFQLLAVKKDGYFKKRS
ncbi:septum formation initiator family protein [Treponema sp. OMZ 788]|uniref:septum formation initiator family protein n=1 Tax=unclassified Treponema TaxID=2638727 RepID=UPI0020A60E39|nr:MULTISPECIES: septum formation initiator family protein [unclassified Treponema]UTC61566.1 septum formation initiator family protein [Treponema sp. OMZ 787]UTC65458.1 septum formation initiator family protein [Treponema sp. OMZ 788]